MEVVKWWKNKWAVLTMVIGVLSVVVGFLFAYFISWGWILSLVIAVAGGISMRLCINKMITEYVEKQK